MEIGKEREKHLNDESLLTIHKTLEPYSAYRKEMRTQLTEMLQAELDGFLLI